MSTFIEKSTIQFLKDLSVNNDKQWFADNKAQYEASYENMIHFAEDLRTEMSKYDNIVDESGKKILFRIYRDVRFSKDKTPYKDHFAGSFKRETARLRGGYYFSVQPGNTFIGGGFWNPNPADLSRLRYEIANDTDAFRNIFADPKLIKNFGELNGDQVKTSPKGYSKDDPAIDLLRYKSYYFGKNYSDKEVMSSDFITKITADYQLLRPWFDLMSDVLTTDTNGVSLLD